MFTRRLIIVLGLLLLIGGLALVLDIVSLRALIRETGVGVMTTLTTKLRARLDHRSAQFIELGLSLVGLVLVVGIVLRPARLWGITLRILSRTRSRSVSGRTPSG